MTLYLDASIIVPLVITEPASEAIRAWLEDQAEPSVVGQFAIGEVVSAISRRRRMQVLSNDQAGKALAAFESWLGNSVRRIDHEPYDVVAATQFVRRSEPKLLMPDALHLATCQRLETRLVTDDSGLAKAADFLRIDWISPH